VLSVEEPVLQLATASMEWRRARNVPNATAEPEDWRLNRKRGSLLLPRPTALLLSDSRLISFDTVSPPPPSKRRILGLAGEQTRVERFAFGEKYEKAGGDLFNDGLLAVTPLASLSVHIVA